MERAYRNVGYFLLGLVPVFVAGFWIPYFSEIPNFDASITPAVHVHAILLFAWIALLIVQAFAVRFRALAIHRQLGKASYFLMALIVPYTVAMLLKEYHERLSTGAPTAVARNAELMSAVQLLVTVAVYVLAIISIRKRDVAAHMRYMICTGIFLLPAGLSRVLGYWFDVRLVVSQTVSFAAIEVCLAALIFFDFRRQLNPRPYSLGFLSFSIAAIGWLAMGRPV